MTLRGRRSRKRRLERRRQREDLMVTSDRPLPNSLSEPFEPRCKVCNQAMQTGYPRESTLWCEACRCFQTVYRGPARKKLCETCFNCVGVDKKGRSLCAAMMYQMPDGTWRDRYNNELRHQYRDCGMDKVSTPIVPVSMNPQYFCESYERLNEGETRETIRLTDPKRFYDKRRFW